MDVPSSTPTASRSLSAVVVPQRVGYGGGPVRTLNTSNAVVSAEMDGHSADQNTVIAAQLATWRPWSADGCSQHI